MDELPVDKFAESLGLPGAPKIKFINKDAGKKKKNASRTVAALQAEIAKEHQAKKAEESDGSESDEASSGDEEETDLAVGSTLAAEEPMSGKTPKASSINMNPMGKILMRYLSVWCPH